MDPNDQVPESQGQAVPTDDVALHEPETHTARIVFIGVGVAIIIIAVVSAGYVLFRAQQSSEIQSGQNEQNVGDVSGQGELIEVIPEDGLPDSSSEDVSPEDEISIEESQNQESIIYGTNQSPEFVEASRTDCKEKGGVFNMCGSACPPDAEVCPAVCALTCEFDNDIN